MIKKYLKDDEIAILVRIFLNLAKCSEENTVDKKTFLIFFKLPGILGERLWAKFDKDHDDVLGMDEFLIGIASACKGGVNLTTKFLFEIYDFHEDGFVHKDDLVTIIHNLKPTKMLEKDDERMLASAQTKKKTVSRV